MRSFNSSLWLLLVASLLGCDSTAERLIKERIRIDNETADRIEKGTIDPLYSQNLWERTQAITKKQAKLILSAEEKKRLDDKYGSELARAEARVQSAMEKKKKKSTGTSSAPDTSAGKLTAPADVKP
jgi:hypothetical protein